MLASWQRNLPLHRLLHDDQKESGLLPVLARLIKQFDRKYQSREHANDLVQCLHVVLRMLERLGKEGPAICMSLEHCVLSLESLPEAVYHTHQTAICIFCCPCLST